MPNSEDKDHDILIRLDERVGVLVAGLAGYREEQDRIEGRVSALEQWRWRTAGFIGLLSSAVGAAVAAIMTRIAGK